MTGLATVRRSATEPVSVAQPVDPATAAPADWDRARARVWAASWAVAATAHAAIVAGAVMWRPSVVASAPPPAALMIELAPIPTSPATPHQVAPGVEQQASRPPEPKVEEPPKPPPVVKKAEAALPKPKPAPPRRPPPPEAPVAERVVAQTTAPPAALAPKADIAAAPAAGASPMPASTAVPTWHGRLLAHLERHKTYPRVAQFRRQQGRSVVRFVMDRAGRVVSAILERSAGYGALDEESLALIGRAQPLPPPPPEVAGDRIEIRVPVEFFLR